MYLCEKRTLIRILDISDKIFKKLSDSFESQRMNRTISQSLVVTFIVTTVLNWLVKGDHVDFGKLNAYLGDPFFAIELCFVVLLMVELLSLVFILPKSVSKSVGKQLELLSLIFIRGAFKEFSHLSDDFQLDIYNIPPPIINMVLYALGSLVIFVLLGYTNQLRKHTPLSKVEADTTRFVKAKKLLALFLFLSFIVILVMDMASFFSTGKYVPSFHTFYTMLIYTDILIVLIALRYTLNYYHIFRYSAFVVATIFIRLALGVKPFYDVMIGIFAAFFVFLLTLTYNHFLNLSANKRGKKD